jgi:uncharacterized protein (TIGR02594 family)
MVRPVSGKIFVAFTAASIGIFVLSTSAMSKPDPRGGEGGAQTEAKRAAQLHHARTLRHAARRQIAPQAQRGPAGAPSAARRSQVGWPTLVTEARKYIGTNPTAMNRRWCARFLNFVLNKTGYAGTNSDAARSFASYGRRVSEPRVGAIAVLSRGKNMNLGHVGIVTGIDANGNPMIISGNHGHKVGESVYPRSRVIAYVMPTTSPQMTQLAAAGAAASPVRAGDADHSLSSPIDELLAAINAESPPSQALAARSQPRLAEPPARPIRTVQVAVPLPTPAPAHVQFVPQPRAAPYRIVQQMPMPIPDPRNVLQ